MTTTNTHRTRSLTTGRQVLVGTLLAASGVLGLAACTSTSQPKTENTPPSPPASAATSTTPTPTRTSPVPPTPLGYTPADPAKIGSWTEFRDAVTGTPDRQAVIRAWRTYLQITAQAANTQGLNVSTDETVKALDAVATASGKTNVFSIVAARRKAGAFTVGHSIVTRTQVQVHGSTATISACINDQSYEVDQSGKTVTPAPGVKAFSSTLVRVGTAWKVTGSALGGRTCPTAG
jgi:hypothetical protein